ncbi:MAG: hypothetical protein RIR31_1405 [Bacteroidota bacterium]
MQNRQYLIIRYFIRVRKGNEATCMHLVFHLCEILGRDRDSLRDLFRLSFFYLFKGFFFLMRIFFTFKNF